MDDSIAGDRRDLTIAQERAADDVAVGSATTIRLDSSVSICASASLQDVLGRRPERLDGRRDRGGPPTASTAPVRRRGRHLARARHASSPTCPPKTALNPKRVTKPDSRPVDPMAAYPARVRAARRHAPSECHPSTPRGEITCPSQPRPSEEVGCVPRDRDARQRGDGAVGSTIGVLVAGTASEHADPRRGHRRPRPGHAAHRGADRDRRHRPGAPASRGGARALRCSSCSARWSSAA